MECVCASLCVHQRAFRSVIIRDRPSPLPKTSTRGLLFFNTHRFCGKLLFIFNLHFLAQLQGEFTPSLTCLFNYIFLLKSFPLMYMLPHSFTLQRACSQKKEKKKTALREQTLIITVLSLMACAIVSTCTNSLMSHSCSFVRWFSAAQDIDLTCQ